MKLFIDTGYWDSITVLKEPTRKIGADGQFFDPETWNTKILIAEKDHDSVVVVTTDYKPDVHVGDEIDLEQMEARPWVSKEGNRNGVSFRARQIFVVDVEETVAA
jgi:hypothetical protein